MYYTAMVTIAAQHRLTLEKVQVLREVICDAATAAGTPVAVQIFLEIVERG